MTRGTTPTLIFKMPIEGSSITNCSVALSQGNVLILDKGMSDCEIEEKVLTCTLTEVDTLKLDSRKPLEIQLRVYCGEMKYASQVFKIPVGKILKEGSLS